MTDWNVLYDKLLVRRHPAPVEIAGIEVPEAAREDQTSGTVVMVGAGRPTPGGDLVPLIVQPGMDVRFSRFAGVPLEGEDKDLLILREDEILAYRTP